MIKREIEGEIEQYLSSDSNKIFFIWGPRRSGKTTLLKKYAAILGERSFNFDFLSDQEFFTANRDNISKLAAEHKFILIDEIQNYPAATKALKLLHDEFKIKIIATGSSELRQKGDDFDSLAGRYFERYCLPISVEESILHAATKSYETKELSHSYAINVLKWGSYPEVILENNETKKIELLEVILNTYVLKDVVNLYNLKDTRLARDILQKIALQIGSEVSLREIAGSLNANVGTVSNYIEIFTKNHVLIQLPGFKTNMRRSISENKKYFFLDLGIRNILIRDFRDIELRTDKGHLFENFIISEFYKHKRNSNLLVDLYFYREYSGREVDLVVESYKKEYKIYEIKLTKESIKPFFPVESEFSPINVKNYYEILRKLGDTKVS